jgi:hypothetical protein
MRTPLMLRVVLLATVIVLAAACGGGRPRSEPASGHPGAAQVSGTIDAQDQAGNGSSVMISSVEIKGAPGWVVIHADVGGSPGLVLGVGHIREGSTSNLVVKLDKPLIATGQVWSMLHVDDHAIGQYEFGKVPGADAPVRGSNGPVTKRITVTVS